ncbi:hypothetical protein V8C35DRAFT_310282 [Trichoderma chlorosporum]
MSVFLIIGASSGLGLALSLAALQRGHRVIGTTRDPVKARVTNPEFESFGGVWLSMDVSSPSCENHVRHITEKENVNVLVNSAGYALLGPVEQISDMEAHAQMETNFHGTLRTIRGVLPAFRSRRSGIIVNITSGAGFIGLASRGLYCSSKFAVEGLSEALANELAPFSIRIIIAEPGAYRTNFLHTLTFPEAGIGEYSGTPAEEMIERTKDMRSRKLGNVHKAASVLLDVILGSGAGADETIKRCLRVPLGQDCWPLAKMKAEAWIKELGTIEGISMSVGKEL